MLDVIAEGTAFRSAAAVPAMELTADGDAGQIKGKTNLGLTEVVMPWEPDGAPAAAPSCGW